MRTVLANTGMLKNYYCRARIFQHTRKRWNWRRWRRLNEICWGYEIEYSKLGRSWRSVPIGPGRPGMHFFGYTNKQECIDAANAHLDRLSKPQEFV